MVDKIKRLDIGIREYKAEIIDFPVRHLKADGTPDMRWGKKAERKRPEGIHYKTRMQCLYNKDEILAVYNIFKDRVDNAGTLAKEKIARRNKSMFVAAINLGLRPGDLCSLRWGNIFDTNWDYIDKPIFVPQKTSKYKTNVELSWNTDFEKELTSYLEWLNNYAGEQLLFDYIFKSQKGGYIDSKEWWKIVETTRKEAGIEQKIGGHGLRKTMVHAYIMEAEDRYDSKIDMQEALKHKSVTTTDRYACMCENKIKEGKQRYAYIHGV